MNPSVGRIVHYHQPDQVPPCRAAIVTLVREQPGGSIDVTVFPPYGEPYPASDLTERPFTPEDGPNDRMVDTWHWPEREA